MRAVVSVLASVAAAACAAGPFEPDAAGRWGGVGIHLSVGSRSSSLELDCAHAELPPLATDGSGAFSASADLVLEGGPEREGVPRETRPVVFEGSVRGDRMTATLRFVDDASVAGPFGLTRGEDGLLRKCL